MNKNEAEKRIIKLREQIADLRYRYHVLNDPNVTDDVYESLTRELKGLEAKYPEFYDINSPVNRVAGKPLDKFVKVKHSLPMLSLNDVFNFEELEAWENRFKKLLPPGSKFDYFCEIKYDGLAATLIYKDGKLIQGSTRGDGIIGEDITKNLMMIDTMPLVLNPKNKESIPLYIEVRGEVVMSKSVLARLNEKNQKEGKTLFANTRNAAAGSVRQLDPNIAKERHLDFFAYDIAEVEYISPSKNSLGPRKGVSQTLANSSAAQYPVSHSQKHKILRELGFDMNKFEKKCANLEEVISFINEFEKERQKLSYGTDGIVISVDSLNLQNILGVVGKAPRFMVAFKYPAERATTRVKDIIVNVGRTGVLTPIAIFEPTLVAGSTVSKATLHNMDQIERLDIRIGDTVVIQKAGDVIPAVVDVLTKMRTGKEKKFKMPEHCPVCRDKVEKRELGAPQMKDFLSPRKRVSQTVKNPSSVSLKTSTAFYCINPICPAKNRRGLQHFVNAFEIYEIGPKILDRFTDEGLIVDAADLFSLKKEDFSSLERFGEKSAKNIIQSIEDHKAVPFWRFIYALGILHVGEQTAQDLAVHFGALEKLMKADLAEIGEIENIGPAVGESIFNYFNKKENIAFIQKLLNNGVKILKQEKIKAGKFTGLKFVITGTLSKMSREKAKEEILKLGGKVGSAVSSETDYLIAGEEAGSKLDKAQKLGTKILDEQSFLKMLGQ